MKGTRLDLRWAVTCEGLTVAAFAWQWQAQAYVDLERERAGGYQGSGQQFGRKLDIKDRRAPRRRRTRG